MKIIKANLLNTPREEKILLRYYKIRTEAEKVITKQ